MSYAKRIASGVAHEKSKENPRNDINNYGEPWDTLCSQIIRETFKEYYEAEKNYKLSIGNTHFEKHYLKKMQECIDFFDSYYGNMVAFNKGQFFKNAMINHMVDLNKLKRSKNY